MKYLFILLCLPQCFGIDLDHGVSDFSMIANSSQSDAVLALGEPNLPTNNKRFDMTALLSTLTDLSVDPTQMLQVITLLTHMIYESTTTMNAIEADVEAETANNITAQNQAAALITEAERQAGNIEGAARALLDSAVDRNTTEYPVLDGEITMLYSVITTLGGDNLRCFPGHPANGCTHTWTGGIENHPTIESCLRAQRARQSDSALTLGIFYHVGNGHCYLYDMVRFDACNVPWIADSFNAGDRSETGWQSCRVWIE